MNKYAAMMESNTEFDNPLFEELYNKNFAQNNASDYAGEELYANKQPKQIIKLSGKFERGTKYSAGYDVYSTESKEILPGKTVMFKTGIKIVSCPTNVYFKIHSRSGLFYRKKIEAFSGVIDADYTDEFKILLTNHSRKTVQISENDSIAQFTVEEYKLLINDKIKLQNHNHTGFGSTQQNTVLTGFGSTQ